MVLGPALCSPGGFWLVVHDARRCRRAPRHPRLSQPPSLTWPARRRSRNCPVAQTLPGTREFPDRSPCAATCGGAQRGHVRRRLRCHVRRPPARPRAWPVHSRTGPRANARPARAPPTAIPVPPTAIPVRRRPRYPRRRSCGGVLGAARPS